MTMRTVKPRRSARSPSAQSHWRACGPDRPTERSGRYLSPPVAGKDSFNNGTRMTPTDTAAAFVKHNLPLGQGGTLCDQEALDVAEDFTHLPRPLKNNSKGLDGRRQTQGREELKLQPLRRSERTGAHDYKYPDWFKDRTGASPPLCTVIQATSRRDLWRICHAFDFAGDFRIRQAVDWRETAARSAEIRRLPLIHSRCGPLNVCTVGV